MVLGNHHVTKEGGDPQVEDYYSKASLYAHVCMSVCGHPLESGHWHVLNNEQVSSRNSTQPIAPKYRAWLGTTSHGIMGLCLAWSCVGLLQVTTTVV